MSSGPFLVYIEKQRYREVNWFQQMLLNTSKMLKQIPKVSTKGLGFCGNAVTFLQFGCICNKNDILFLQTPSNSTEMQ